LGHAANLGAVRREEPEVPSLPIPLDLGNGLLHSIQHVEPASDREQLALEAADFLAQTISDGDVRPHQGEAAAHRQNHASPLPFAYFDQSRQQPLVDNKAKQLEADADVLLGNPDLRARRRIVDVERAHELRNADPFLDEKRLEVEHEASANERVDWWGAFRFSAEGSRWNSWVRAKARSRGKVRWKEYVAARLFLPSIDRPREPR